MSQNNDNVNTSTPNSNSVTDIENKIKSDLNINLKPTDFTSQDTFVQAHSQVSDPDDVMAISVMGHFPETDPHKYQANLDLHSNRATNETLFNPILDTVGQNMLGSGFGYSEDSVGGTTYGFSRVYNTKEFTVKNDDNYTVFLQLWQAFKDQDIARAYNNERNYATQSFGKYAHILMTADFDVNENHPNVIPLHKLFSYTRTAQSSYNVVDHYSIIKASTLAANIRNHVNFPYCQEKVPFPTSDNCIFLDLSPVAEHFVNNDPMLEHLWKICPQGQGIVTINGKSGPVRCIVDMSDTVEGTFTYSASSLTAWNVTVPEAKNIAKILDCTLTRQDIRWGLFLSALPLPRFITTTNLNFAVGGTNVPQLKPNLPVIDNREVLLKWLNKKSDVYNEYTLSNMLANTKFFSQLVRDIRICKTSLIQVASDMLEISYIPDSNKLFKKEHYEQLISYNLNGLGDLYLYTFTDSTHQFSNWFAWIPYELAQSTNKGVNIDKITWDRSFNGSSVADSVLRSPSIVIPRTYSNQLILTAVNKLDDPLVVEANISSSRRLTIAAVPISMYWDTSKGPIFSLPYSEGEMIQGILLKDYRTFPSIKVKTNWN